MTQVNGSVWLLATANGGIWKTNNLHATPRPHWEQKLDGQPVACSSISAMESIGDTVLAGCGGATSAEMGYDWMVSNVRALCAAPVHPVAPRPRPCPASRPSPLHALGVHMNMLMQDR